MRKAAISIVLLLAAGAWAQSTGSQPTTANTQSGATTQQQVQQRERQRQQERRQDMQTLRSERMKQRQEELKKIQDQLAKMKTQLESMKANAEKIKDQAAKQALLTNVDMWQAMLDHMKQMADRMQNFTPAPGMRGKGPMTMPAPPPQEAPQTVPKQ